MQVGVSPAQHEPVQRMHLPLQFGAGEAHLGEVQVAAGGLVVLDQVVGVGVEAGDGHPRLTRQFLLDARLEAARGLGDERVVSFREIVEVAQRREADVALEGSLQAGVRQNVVTPPEQEAVVVLVQFASVLPEMAVPRDEPHPWRR